MLAKMPIIAHDTTRFEPPYEINGKGIPVNGMRDTMALKLIIICKDRANAIPPARSFPKSSDAVNAIRRAESTRTKNKIITIVAPINPNSSPIIAKIESVVTSGRYAYFCRDSPIPTPKSPPDPNAICICRT